ncbi:MAG: hypothetical protein OJI70_13025 [Zavarzinia sp.]|nr:hypothetical protein [Zavarzinia sp.]
MEHEVAPDPRDLDLEARIERLVRWPLGSDGDRLVTLDDAIAANGDDPALICRRILRTDGGPAEFANILRRLTLDGEACPDPEGIALSILSSVRNGRNGYERPANRLGVALILIPGAIAGLGLAGGISPYLLLLVGAGWIAGWRLLRRG